MSYGEIIFIFIALLAGLLLGLLLGLLFGGRSKPEAETPPDEWTVLRRQFQERASLWKVRAGGQLAVRLNGRMVTAARELSEDELKQLQAALADGQAWLGTPAAPAPAAQPAAPASAAQPARPAPAVILTPPPPPAVRSSAPAAELTILPGAPAPAVERPKTIVEQIDEILQELLADSPARARGVRLMQDARQQVVVRVGLETFEGVDAVTDPEVKALLRAAAAEWERRSGRL